VASVLLYIERTPEGISPASRRCLEHGRRLASELGAGLHVAAAVAEQEMPDALIGELGGAGADKIVLLGGALRPSPAAEPAIWTDHGPWLRSALLQLRPRLVLLPDTSTGRELGPRLAAILAAVYVSGAAPLRDEEGDLVLCERTCAGTLERRVPLRRTRTPVVATLATSGGVVTAGLTGAGSASPGAAADPADTTAGAAAVGGEADDAEVSYVAAPAELPGRVSAVESVLAPELALEEARIVVTAGAGIRDRDSHALVEELARLLGAELGATAELCARGLAPRARQVGARARHVRPALYVVCAASGSPEHLAGVRGAPLVVAIDRDPEAPIFRAATWGLLGEVETVLPGLLEALRRGLPLGSQAGAPG
jgi:electron transfer flavoprotein alpha subunit